MNIVLIAPPAAGKGTLAEMLVKNNNFVTVSAGQLLRNVDPDSEVGKNIRQIQEKGLLVDNSITGTLMKDKLKSFEKDADIILDGFPREMNQVVILDEIMEEINSKVDYAIYLNVPFEIALERTLGRQVCPKCKKTYNKFGDLFKPRNENICDICGSELTLRNDDNEESLNQRFKLFDEISKPVVDYYKSKNILIELDASKDINSLYEELIGKIIYDKN